MILLFFHIIIMLYYIIVLLYCHIIIVTILLYWDMLGSLLGHLLVMSGSLFHISGGRVGMCFGTLWGGLGRFVEKVPPRLENQDFQKCPGVFFLRQGAQNNNF